MGFRLSFLLLSTLALSQGNEFIDEILDDAEMSLRHHFPKMESCSLGGRKWKKVTKESLKMSKRNALFRIARDTLNKNGSLFDERTNRLLSESLEIDMCSQEKIDCSFKSKYRTIDGTCNNPRRKRLGSSGRPLRRLLKAEYGNRDSNPRTMGQFHPQDESCTPSGVLPNPRLVSSKFNPDMNIPSSLATHMLTQMGQFIDHDMSFTPETHVEHCCDDPSQSGCSPISIPGEDSFFSSHSQTCLEFTRSEHFCDSSPREQFNTLTSFIDASNVYGSTQEMLNELKEPESFLLKVSKTSTGKDLLPRNEDGIYFAGDVRAIEMPGLASMHTLFVREHNRIAKWISESFPSLESNTVFEEARRIVIAEMQNVVFGQYMEGILSNSIRNRFNLNIKKGSRYRRRSNPTITNAFATAAYRFGHSMIQGDIKRIALSISEENSTYSLRDVFFNMDNYEGKDGAAMEEIINGLVHQPSQSPDRFVVDDITNHLFNGGNSFGSDLIARNIARGRDHGLPSYGKWREFCGLKSLCSWEDKPQNIPSEYWNILRELYTSPNDIDLFVGGLAEISKGRSPLGSTFSCIIGDQFDSLKRGDRYFFTHEDQAGSFGAEQVDMILNRHLGQIICDNTDIQRVRENVFDLNSPWIDCPPVSSLDLSVFFP